MAPLGNSLMRWRDPLNPYDVKVVGLTSEGSAVFYAVDCPLINRRSFYPAQTCLSDSDCGQIPNTNCAREQIAQILPGTTLKLLTCQCLDGFEPIPDPYRLLLCCIPDFCLFEFFWAKIPVLCCNVQNKRPGTAIYFETNFRTRSKFLV